jgi:hypothetical protein
MERKIEWAKIEAGLYRNHESGVEIERIGGRWETTRPLSAPSRGDIRASQRTKKTFRKAREAAEQHWILAVHRPMVEDAYDEAIVDELTREAARARNAGVTLVWIQDILDGDTSVERKLALVKAHADDAEKKRTQTARLVAAIMDGGDDDENGEVEEILRDVIVAQVMDWAARGSDPTDLAKINQAAANYRTWEAQHRPVCGVCDEPGHDEQDCPR